MTTIAVISAGLGTPSASGLLADRLTEAVMRHGDDITVSRIELRGLAHPITDALLTGFPTPELAAALQTVTDADGLIVVTPTFSASYSGVFKSFFDVIEPGALTGKPVVLGATGGTERHSLVIDYALRPLFSYLGAEPVRTGVFAATSDFGGEVADALSARIDRAGAELAAAVGKPRPVPAKGATDVSKGGEPFTPFDQLLQANR